MTRSEVYHLINGEREYQDNLWGDLYDPNWSPSDWLIFIGWYLEEARNGLKGCANVAEGREKQMNSIRKIAALAVAAMENNDTPNR